MSACQIKFHRKLVNFRENLKVSLNNFENMASSWIKSSILIAGFIDLMINWSNNWTVEHDRTALLFSSRSAFFCSSNFRFSSALRFSSSALSFSAFRHSSSSFALRRSSSWRLASSSLCCCCWGVKLCVSSVRMSFNCLMSCSHFTAACFIVA